MPAQKKFVKYILRYDWLITRQQAEKVHENLSSEN